MMHIAIALTVLVTAVILVLIVGSRDHEEPLEEDEALFMAVVLDEEFEEEGS